MIAVPLTQDTYIVHKLKCFANFILLYQLYRVQSVRLNSNSQLAMVY